MEIRELMKLDEVFPDSLVGKGIFHYLDELDVPWKGEIQPLFLDMQYHGNRSGCKYVSPLVKKLAGQEESVTESLYTSLASVLWSLYGLQWSKLYATLSLEYNPIHNYDMNENEEITREGSSSTSSSQTRTDNLSHKREADNSDTETGTVGVVTASSNEKTLDLSHTKTGTDTDKQTGTVKVATTEGGTVSVEGQNTSDNANNIYGYNSGVAVPSDKSSTSGTTSSTTTNNLNGTNDTTNDLTVAKTINETIKDTGTDSDSGSGSSDETRNLTFGHKISDTTTDTGTVSQEGSGSGQSSGSETRKLSRSGNIGVTTSQQMIKSERELWLWTFFERVFSDIDSVLVLQIF